MRSPVDGTLATVDVVAGSTVRPQQLLATIVPEQSSLAADVYVPSRAVGMVQPGQAVRLLYDAFPHQQFGTAPGEVAAVAGFVSLPADMPVASGLREAAYKVRIHVADKHVEDAQGRYALRPGMALAAEIVLESRSLADWLFAPVRSRL
jgi:membrane fusion protein